MKAKSDEFLMVTGAAKILDRSAQTVRFYERTGKLAAIRTADGTRLFRQSDVEALAAKLSRTESGDRPSPEAL
jgi:DNA-binding transcriptional MerR regulator